ncbi:sensor domain-containing diguanylate cyclase [Pandoraea nosoerga]|uniref:diguanylate cyclase n=1 Tax=Pandoraea nosoerga TaxID=2508296 RepID=A0A5E4Y0T8_9BURK|nr:sensor domain-containing diguanylate cyclase [Pandoraea nosoerga]VVE41912.1 GGDEF domain-containing protein [Pandoraea nosoerga]
MTNVLFNRRRAAPVLVAGLVALACVVIAWGLARFAADQLVANRSARLLYEERSVASRLAHGTVHTVNQDLILIRGIPQVLAQIEQIQAAAEQIDDHPVAGLPPAKAREALLANATLKPVNELLHATQLYFGADLVWLATPDGTTIASSDAHTADPLVGENYGDREYFRIAVLGGNGQQYVIGRKTRLPGIYFTAPVYQDGRLVGVAVVKLGLRRLAHWVDSGLSFVTDKNGVIVLANDPTFTGMAVPGAGVFKLTPAERRRIYQQEDFTVVPIENYDLSPATPAFLENEDVEDGVRDPRLVRVRPDDQPYLLEADAALDSELVIYTMSEVPTLGSLFVERRRYAVLVFALLLSSAGALFMLIRYLRREKLQLTDTLAKNAALEHEVKYDALTGALSRGHFLKRLRAELMQASATEVPTSIILVDLDHFKQINDTWGHALGDTVLATFVRLCHESLREDDICGRLGGEEFAIILSGANEARAFEAAERLREAVRSARIVVDARTLQFTISAGVAEWHAGDDDNAWLQRADAALYLAKSRGRDRCARESDLRVLSRAGS